MGKYGQCDKIKKGASVLIPKMNNYISCRAAINRLVTTFK